MADARETRIQQGEYSKKGKADSTVFEKPLENLGSAAGQTRDRGRAHAFCTMSIAPSIAPPVPTSPHRSKLPVMIAKQQQQQQQQHRPPRANRMTSPETTFLPRGEIAATAPFSVDMFTTAPKDPDNPVAGSGSSPKIQQEEYDDEFPSLPPAHAPALTLTPAHAQTPDVVTSGNDRGDSSRNEVAARVTSAWSRNRPLGNMSRPNAVAEASHHQARHSGSTTVASGSPPRFTDGYGVVDRDDASSGGFWDAFHHREHANMRGGGAKRQESPISFGDDLDERSDQGGSEAVSGDHHAANRAKRGWRVRLAGWNTPMHRRLQTLMVLLHCLFMGLLFTLFCFLCTMPLLWPIVGTYLVYIRFSGSGTDGRDTFRNEKFRRSRIWRYFADYFPAALHKTADLPPTRKYILAVHPHGIISHGAWAAFATDALDFSGKFPGVTNHLLTLNGNFNTPLYREYLLAMGLQSVSRESITNILTKGGANGEGMGRAVSIVVGGAREALEGQPGTMRLIMSRRGFCRMALRTGADLVPVLVFGENDLYSQWSQRDHPRFHRLQMKLLSWMGFSFPVLQGRGVFNYDFGILPRRCPLNVVVGAPIPVEQVRPAGGGGGDDDSSSKTAVDRATEELHGMYCRKLIELYEAHKDEFARDRSEEMQFID